MNCDAASDVVIRAGNNHSPAIWQFLISETPDVLWSLAGSEFYLSVQWREGLITVNTVDDPTVLVIDQGLSTVTWYYTTEQSREIPLGRRTIYDLERRIGLTQQTLITGNVVVLEGINID